MAAESLAKEDANPNAKKAKHIELRYHIVRDLVDREIVDVARVPTKENTADLFTKPLERPLFEKHRDRLLVY